MQESISIFSQLKHTKVIKQCHLRVKVIDRVQSSNLFIYPSFHIGGSANTTVHVFSYILYYLKVMQDQKNSFYMGLHVIKRFYVLKPVIKFGMYIYSISFCSFIYSILSFG